MGGQSASAPRPSAAFDAFEPVRPIGTGCRRELRLAAEGRSRRTGWLTPRGNAADRLDEATNGFLRDRRPRGGPEPRYRHRHLGRAPSGRSGQAHLVARSIRTRVALARGARGQSLVSDDADLPPTTPR